MGDLFFQCIWTVSRLSSPKGGITMNGATMPKVFRVGFVLLFLIAPPTWSGDSPGQMLGLSVSPDGKFLATTYVKGSSWRIYKIELTTGNATRLTNATTG